jgi:hypothetical protein
MERMIAYCGLVCTDCPAYVATQAGDIAALKRVASQWREEFNSPDISVENIRCDGCLTDQGYKFGHCSQCPIRACGMERGVPNCGHCGDYACDQLQEFFGLVPEARTLLDSVHAELTTWAG